MTGRAARSCSTAGARARAVPGRARAGLAARRSSPCASWPADDYTRVTIESDAELSAGHFVADSLARAWSSTSTTSELSPQLRELAGTGAQRRPVHRRRARGPEPAARGAPGVRPETATAPQQFSLAPVGAYQVAARSTSIRPRRTAAAGPGARKEAAEQQAANAVRDALGDLIGRIDWADGRAGAAAAAGPPRPRRSSDASPAAEPARRRRRWRRAASTASSSWPSTPATAARDPGAIGPGGLREKDVVLAIALQLRDG